MPPKPPLTHFLCLPLLPAKTRHSFVESIDNLRAAIVAETPPADAAFINSAIRPTGTLHLTIGVMSLSNNSKLGAATDFLRSLDMTSLLQAVDPSAAESSSPRNRTSRLRIDLGQLSAMGDPVKASVLYLEPIDKSNRLYRFCVAIHDAFSKAGLLVPQHRELILHVTIVNTIYAPRRRDHTGDMRGRSKRPYSFDASCLVDRLTQRTWVEGVDLDRLSICKMGAVKVLGDDGKTVCDEFYEEVMSQALPFAT